MGWGFYDLEERGGASKPTGETRLMPAEEARQQLPVLKKGAGLVEQDKQYIRGKEDIIKNASGQN